MKPNKTFAIVALFAIAVASAITVILLLRDTDTNPDYQTAQTTYPTTYPTTTEPSFASSINATIELNQPHFTIMVGDINRVRTADIPMTWPARDTYTSPQFTLHDTNIAIIHNNGFIEGIAPGITYVIAERDGEYGLATVEIIPLVRDGFDYMRMNYRATLIPWELDTNDPRIVSMINNFDNRAAQALSTMNRSFEPDIPGMPWTDLGLPIGESAETGFILLRILHLAEAFVVPGRHHLDPELFDTVEAGLEWFLDNVFRGRVTHQQGQIMLNNLYPISGPYMTPESYATNRLIRTMPEVYSTNWWQWDIGMPLRSIPAITLMYDFGLSRDLIHAYARRIRIYTPNTVNRVTLNDTGTPSHQTYKNFFAVMDGVFLRDEERVRQASSSFMTGGQLILASGLLPVTNSANGNGFYWDGSEKGHNFFASQMSYGIGALNAAVRTFIILNDASIDDEPVTFDPNTFGRFVDLLDVAYLPAVWRGAGMPSLMGRGISRGNVGGDAGLTGILSDYLGAFEGERRLAVEEHLASWMHHNPAILNGASIVRYPNLRRIADDPNIVPREHVGVFAQNHASRLFYQGTDFVFNLAFNNFFANTSPHTTVNQENLRGVFMGEGMTYVFLNNDQFQYGGNFFAAVDYFRLPGTTVEHRGDDWDWVPTAHIQPNLQQNLGGTAVLRDSSGEFASTAFRQNFEGNLITTRDSDLRANKSWFMIDGRIIAMGTDITSTRNRPVATSVDQRRIPTGEITSFVLNGNPVGQSSDRVTTVNSWVHLSYMGTAQATGSATGDGLAHIGYFIPGAGQSITIGAQERVGTWYDTNRLSGSQAPQTALFADVFINHGNAPAGEFYEYVILPNFTESEMADFAARQASDNPFYTTLAKTTTLHSVFAHDLNLIMINNFAYEPATVVSPSSGRSYTINTVGSAIIREHADGTVHVVIHDPTGRNDVIYVDISGAATHVSGDGNMELSQPEDGISRVTASQLTGFERRRFASWEMVVRVG